MDQIHPMSSSYIVDRDVLKPLGMKKVDEKSLYKWWNSNIHG